MEIEVTDVGTYGSFCKNC